ncbi:putative leader peptide [Streptomyces sp. CWNU-52B]
MVRRSVDLNASIATAPAFFRFSRRRHIDLQRITSCLCHG